MSNILNITSSLMSDNTNALAPENTAVGAADVGEPRAQMVDEGEMTLDERRREIAQMRAEAEETRRRTRALVQQRQQERAMAAAERRDPTAFGRRARARADRGVVESKGDIGEMPGAGG
jgi:hypothetical protein